MVTEIQLHATNVLEAMYEAYRADTDQDVAIADYFKKADVDPAQEGFEIVDFLANGDLVRTHHASGTPGGMITPTGINAVQELRNKRRDPKARDALLRSAMLRWLDEQEEADAYPNSFQEFVDSLTEEDEKFSLREFRAAAEYLHSNGLITAVHVEEEPSEGWNGPRLTPEGRAYLTDHGGDVAEYLRERRGGSPTHHNSIHIGGDNKGNFVVGSENCTQNYTAGLKTEDLVHFAELVRETLDALKGVDQATKDQLGEAADALKTEATTAAPERGRLRQLVDRLRAGVNAAAPTAVKTVLIAAGEVAAKAITS
ncbi:hypothetical protein [Kribbella sp. NPDC004536]|uniref:hypothetical protein n=1 Tax=Kribbella sp. NPDC004536 TaxID=3364106 RepID=UPI00367C56D4